MHLSNRAQSMRPPDEFHEATDTAGGMYGRPDEILQAAANVLSDVDEADSFCFRKVDAESLQSTSKGSLRTLVLHVIPDT